MRVKKIVTLVVLIILAVSFILYAYYPVTVSKDLQITDEHPITFNSVRTGIPLFSNMTIPSNAISVDIEVSMNSTYYLTGGTVNPESVIIGKFSGNQSSYGMQKAGYYQPSKGYYEIILNQLSYSYEVPIMNPNGTLNQSTVQYYNYKYLGKSYNIGIDPSLSHETLYSTINW